jgi:hypothetical protein
MWDGKRTPNKYTLGTLTLAFCHPGCARLWQKAQRAERNKPRRAPRTW